MTKYEMMDSLVENNAGYLLTSTVQEAGISRTYLMRYVRERDMERVEQGIYVSPDTLPDPLFVLQLKNAGVIYSHETALYLHGLMEREPSRIFVSVKRGYNATHLINRGIKPFFIRHEFFDTGVTAVKTACGNEVRAYDIDRTVCDIVRRKEEMDVQVFQTAMKGDMAGNQKNLHRLMAYAKALRVDRRIKDYTEMML